MLYLQTYKPNVIYTVYNNITNILLMVDSQKCMIKETAKTKLH